MKKVAPLMILSMIFMLFSVVQASQQFTTTITGTATEKWTTQETMDWVSLWWGNRTRQSLMQVTGITNYKLTVEIPSFYYNTTITAYIYEEYFDNYEYKYKWRTLKPASCPAMSDPPGGCKASVDVSLNPSGRYEWEMILSGTENNIGEAKITYLTTVNWTMHQKGMCNISDTITFSESSKNIGRCNITFAPNYGGTISNESFSVSSDNPNVSVVFSDTNAPKTTSSLSSLIASILLDQFTLTVTKEGTGSGTVTSSVTGISCGADCTELYNSGEVVMLAAASNTGSIFTSWSGDPDCFDGQITVNANKTCTANFNLQTNVFNIVPTVIMPLLLSD